MLLVEETNTVFCLYIAVIVIDQSVLFNGRLPE